MFSIYFYLHRYQQKSLYVLELESTVKREVTCSSVFIHLDFLLFVCLFDQLLSPANHLSPTCHPPPDIPLIPFAPYLLLIPFGWNNISPILWVYWGSISKQNTTTAFLRYNASLLCCHIFNGRIIFLSEMHNRMAVTSYHLWHLSDAKLTHIFNHRFLQDRSW